MTKLTFAIKRAHPRFSYSAEAEATFQDGTTVDAQILEISSRGCYIDAIKPIPIGTELQLRISNGTSMCELQGKVIYTHPGFGMGISGMGVLFEDMAEEQRLAIESLLCELASKHAGASPS
jgi:hypothetical protein